MPIHGVEGPVRVWLLVMSLLVLGCVREVEAPTGAFTPTATAQVVTEEPSEDWLKTPPEVEYSPFLPALARAGLWPRPYPYVVIERIDYRGTIVVENAIYFVLYIDCYLQLTDTNQRGHSSWLICDTDLNPVWDNPDWGGTPGECFGNHIRVHLSDKWFSIRNVDHGGDLLSFARDGAGLVASLNWESDQ